MRLSPTAKAILGTLYYGPKSGYEIKGMVDHSTRFFWAASYGQIYPELKRLAEAGLVSGVDDPQGGRARTVWSLTPDGEAVLQDWLETPSETFEMRHEGMLKLFFADALEPEQRIERLRDMADLHRAKLERLHEIEPFAAQDPEGSRYLVLRFGIEFNQWAIDWCEREAAALKTPAAAEGNR